MDAVTTQPKVALRPATPLDRSNPPVPDLVPGTRVIPAGSVHVEGARPVPIDIEVLEDVAIPMRDGVVLYGDVYRPQGVTTPLPAILIYTPYTKRGGIREHRDHPCPDGGAGRRHLWPGPL